MAGPIRISILANASQAKREINGVGESAEHGVSRAKSALKGLAAGFIAFEAFDKVKDVLKESIGEAREAQKVNAQTAAVIKSTGGAAKVSAAHVHEYAQAIGRSTGQNADLIQSNANVLLTFKGVQNQVGKGNDIFDQATKTMVDMSTALGQDGKSSAIQLGKALNDPIRGITALRRVGVTFTTQQQDQIKKMVESGHTMSAQKIILRELNSEFGGSAKAQATAGDKMRETFREVEEEIGAKLLPILDKVETYVAEHLPDWFAKGERAVDKVKGAFEKVEPTIETVVGFLKDNKGSVVAFIAVLAGFQILSSITKGVIALNAALAANPFVLVAVGLALLAAGLVYAYKHSETFRKIVNESFSAVVAAGKFMWEKGLHPAFDGIVSAIKVVGQWGKWLWNTIFEPVFKFLVKGIAVVLGMWAKMLNALGHVPGFGWAKDAAKAMQYAADKANGIADALHKIPSRTNATVVLNVVEGVVHTAGGRVPLDPSSARSQLTTNRSTAPPSRTINLTVNAPVGSDSYTIGETLRAYLDEYEAGAA